MAGDELNRKGLSDQVAERILETIMSGQLMPGDSLPATRELTERYGVSRTVVREAIRTLEARGIVSVSQGKPPVIRDRSAESITQAVDLYLRMDEKSVVHLVEVRFMLEVQIAEKAALSATPENIAALEAAIDRQRRAGSNVDFDAVNPDLDFHLELARATQNPVVLAMFQPVISLVREHRRRLFRPEKVEESIRGHERILAAVRAGDPEAARQAMQEHLELVRQDLDAFLAKQNENHNGDRQDNQAEKRSEVGA